MIDNMNFKKTGEFGLIDFGSLELEINKLTEVFGESLDTENVQNIFDYFKYKRIINYSYGHKKN